MKAYSLAYIDDIVKVWAARLGLSHWEISLRVGEPESETEGTVLMEIQRHEHHHRAVITVAVWLVDGDEPPEVLLEPITDEFVEQVAVHELCHLPFRDVVFPVKHDVEEFFGQVAHELLMRRLHAAEEQSADLLARGLVAAWRARG